MRTSENAVKAKFAFWGFSEVRALKLDDRPVRELMTPQPNVVWLDADDPPEETLRQTREARHSFFPVARRDLDDLLGIASEGHATTRPAASA